MGSSRDIDIFRLLSRLFHAYLPDLAEIDCSEEGEGPAMVLVKEQIMIGQATSDRAIALEDNQQLPTAATRRFHARMSLECAGWT